MGTEGVLVSMVLDKAVDPDARFDFAVYDPQLRKTAGMEGVHTADQQGYMNATEAGAFMFSGLCLGPGRPHYLAEEKLIH